jgi:tRNA(Arg) A34 adenosine deaminase TadA
MRLELRDLAASRSRHGDRPLRLLLRRFGGSFQPRLPSRLEKQTIARLSMELDHDEYMDRAIALGLRKPRAPFGALVVAAGSGEVLAEGVNSVEGSPTRHGEMVAIDAWAAAHGSRDHGNLVLYTTAEPCPMCMAAIAWARIETVVFGSSIPHLVRMGWSQIEIRAAEIARRSPFVDCRIIGGVRQAECDRLFARPPDVGVRA